MTYQEYIDREVVKETEKAYLVKQEVNNRRDGWYTKFVWVAKSQCKPISEEKQRLYDQLDEAGRKFVGKLISVPTSLVGNAVW